MTTGRIPLIDNPRRACLHWMYNYPLHLSRPRTRPRQICKLSSAVELSSSASTSSVLQHACRVLAGAAHLIILKAFRVACKASHIPVSQSSLWSLWSSWSFWSAWLSWSSQSLAIPAVPGGSLTTGSTGWRRSHCAWNWVFLGLDLVWTWNCWWLVSFSGVGGLDLELLVACFFVLGREHVAGAGQAEAHKNKIWAGRRFAGRCKELAGRQGTQGRQALFFL